MKKLICAVTVLAVSTAQADTIYVDIGNCPLSDCCIGNGSPGCDDQRCEAIVCAAFPNCCSLDWSDFCAGRAFHVCETCPPSGGNGSELDPYCSIQTAIDNAVDTDEIVVAPGTYSEFIDFIGKAITLRSSDGPEVTTIRPPGAGNAVVCDHGEGVNTVFDGFTIFGGVATVGPAMANVNSSPTVTNCTFSGNRASGQGGGMYNWNNSHPTVTNCTFSGNFAGQEGGAIHNSGDSNSTLTNCILWGNIGDTFAEIDGSATVAYSDVSGGFPGTGNIDADPHFVAVHDCCITRPTNQSGCSDPACELAVCEVEPGCCDQWWYSACAELAADLCAMCPNDYRLSAGSPSIDAGDNTAVPEDIDTDLDGNPRFLEIPETPDTGNGTLPIVDMGAYESLGGGCLAVTSQEVVCHADGTTFTVNIEGLNACTGGTTQVTFTASGGAVGEDLCFTALVNDGGFCCTTEICVTIPDCTPAASPSDLDGDGIVDIVDFLAILAAWGPCSDCGNCPADFDGDCSVGILDLLILLGNWGWTA